MNALVAQAPTRLDFGGGWTDVPPYSYEQGGFVCNVAIALRATVRLRSGASTKTGDAPPVADATLAASALRRARLGHLHVSIENAFPLGAGLGGSSAVGVAMAGAIRAWKGDTIDRSAMAEESRRVEVDDIGVAGGRQDHYAAAYGGALALEFGETTRVRQLPLPAPTVRSLEERCIVAYTGQSRISGDTINAVLDAYAERNGRVMHALARMKALAVEMVPAIDAGDLDTLGALIGEHWIHQRALHPSIPTPLIDTILERGGAAGAIGGKALGASGGGCVLLVAREDCVVRVREVVGSLARILPVEIDTQGFRWEASE
jgi:D-glycero-alpha-D-manno-heptose-7-phosphate kinase